MAPEILSSALFSPLSTLSPGMSNSSLSYRNFLPLLSPPWPLVFLDTSTWVAFEYLTLSMCYTECVSSSSISSCLLLFYRMLCPQSSKEVYCFFIFIFLFGYYYNQIKSFIIYYLINIYFLFICAKSKLQHVRFFSCSIWTLSCDMQDLVPWPGIKPRPPALETWHLSHWTTREILTAFFTFIFPPDPYPLSDQLFVKFK